MPIRNKDGTIYQLTKPNPLMRTQDEWSNEDVKIHNLTHEEEKMIIPEVVVKHSTPFEEICPEPEIIPERKEVVRNKLIAWCLPAVNKVIEDPLYGERKSVEYSEKISFETIMIEQDRLFCILWAKMGDLPKNSILYLYNGTRQLSGEWWKVSEVTIDGEGILINCVITSENPSF